MGEQWNGDMFSGLHLGKGTGKDVNMGSFCFRLKDILSAVPQTIGLMDNTQSQL